MKKSERELPDRALDFAIGWLKKDGKTSDPDPTLGKLEGDFFILAPRQYVQKSVPHVASTKEPQTASIA